MLHCRQTHFTSICPPTLLPWTGDNTQDPELLELEWIRDG